jgi:hypothetical protein
MGEAATPGVGEAPSAEAKSAYTAALADVAKKVKGEDVARVAAALAANGADGEAAKLLPAVYPDRAQKGGSFLYGAVAVEAGTCGGKKSAVVHTVSVSEPGKRWSIDADLEAALASVKPKLDKSCTAEPLVVLHTPGPVKSAEEVEAFQEGVVKKWEGNGFAVKTQKEKALTLP